MGMFLELPRREQEGREMQRLRNRDGQRERRGRTGREETSARGKGSVGETRRGKRMKTEEENWEKTPEREKEEEDV